MSRWLQTMTISWTWRHPSTHPPHSSQSPTMRTISLHSPSATMPRRLRKHVWSGAWSGAHNLLLTILTTSSEDVGDVSFTLHPFSSHPPDDILGSKTSGSTCSMKLSSQFVCNPVISISLFGLYTFTLNSPSLCPRRWACPKNALPEISQRWGFGGRLCRSGQFVKKSAHSLSYF